jgi:glycosyltransferase involved in cell wall biosynthesis
MPIINDVTATSPGIKLANDNQNNNAVFSGGLSDRDFETVIKAFTNTKVPVRIAVSNSYVFKNPELITDNFIISRNVSKAEYHSLILSSSFLVIALEYENSSCGQLLFTFGMKNGIPIIATDCFGTRDYITHNDNGILVPLKDDRAIYNAYTMLVNDEVLRNKLVQRSLEISKQLTFENYLIKIDSIIKQVNRS